VTLLKRSFLTTRQNEAIPNQNLKIHVCRKVVTRLIHLDKVAEAVICEVSWLGFTEPALAHQESDNTFYDDHWQPT
jgi:hypothetical protein